MRLLGCQREHAFFRCKIVIQSLHGLTTTAQAIAHAAQHHAHSSCRRQIFRAMTTPLILTVRMPRMGMIWQRSKLRPAPATTAVIPTAIPTAMGTAMGLTSWLGSGSIQDRCQRPRAYDCLPHGVGAGNAGVQPSKSWIAFTTNDFHHAASSDRL